MMRAVVPSADVPEGAAIEVTAEGETGPDAPAAIVLRYDGGLYAYRNLCPHLRIPLNLMPDQFFNEEGNALVCSTHGAMFEPDTGMGFSGPCVGRPLPVLTVTESDGQIEVQF